LHDGEEGKGNHTQRLISRFLGHCAAKQLVAAWVRRADHACPSPLGCGSWLGVVFLAAGRPKASPNCRHVDAHKAAVLDWVVKM